MANLSLEDWRNIATIFAAVVALAVYITNSIRQHRLRKLESTIRYIAAHRKLFESKFIVHHWKAFQNGTFKRDKSNKEMEAEFAWLLGDIDYFALLQETHAISEIRSTYMFGWWAQRLQPLLTSAERNNVYWEVAVCFLDKMKLAADDFYKKTKKEREKYFKFQHFNH